MKKGFILAFILMAYPLAYAEALKESRALRCTELLAAHSRGDQFIFVKTSAGNYDIVEVPVSSVGRYVAVYSENDRKDVDPNSGACKRNSLNDDKAKTRSEKIVQIYRDVEAYLISGARLEDNKKNSRFANELSNLRSYCTHSFPEIDKYVKDTPQINRCVTDTCDQ